MKNSAKGITQNAAQNLGILRFTASVTGWPISELMHNKLRALFLFISYSKIFLLSHNFQIGIFMYYTKD